MELDLTDPKITSIKFYWVNREGLYIKIYKGQSFTKQLVPEKLKEGIQKYVEECTDNFKWPD